MKCYNCDNEATHIVYWPGVTPVGVCKEHVGAAERIAASLKMEVKIEEVKTEDAIPE